LFLMNLDPSTTLRQAIVVSLSNHRGSGSLRSLFIGI
jgi:hypothetical protein